MSGLGAGVLDQTMGRKFLAELIGTALFVFFGAGMATVVFGFRAFGSSVAAGILLAGLVFGLILTGLVALIGTVSGCHVNPAVTVGAYLVRRIPASTMIIYWIAQLIGALLGALLLLWVMHSSPFYTRSRIGLGAQGYGRLSLLHIGGGGAFLAEVILTAAFVLVWLAATRKGAPVPVAGLIVGFAIALANIMGMAIDGASINPARSFGPAIVVGGLYLSQLWVFLIAPMLGGILAALVYMLFHRASEAGGLVGMGGPMRPATTMAGAEEDESRRQQQAAASGTAVSGATPAGASTAAGARQTTGYGATGAGATGTGATGTGGTGGATGGSAVSGQADSGQPGPPGGRMQSGRPQSGQPQGGQGTPPEGGRGTPPQAGG